jgi:sigma-E factor negative regulatory protein RseB
LRLLENTAAVRALLAVRLSKSFILSGIAMTVMMWSLLSAAQPHPQPAPVLSVVVEGAGTDRRVNDWLIRVHEASRRRAYVGIFVVSAGDRMSSARIWHVCDGEQQMERVESLTGAPRSTFRRNDQVVTFLPQSRVVVEEKRESLGLFPNLLRSNASSIAKFYRVSASGSERVAGFEADRVQLWPQDSLRFGYRVWTEKNSGLIVKMQTLDNDGHVLEQAAFSELQLDAPVSMTSLTQMMSKTEGYQVEKPDMVKITASAEGWALKTAVPGFKSMSCYRRLVRAGVGATKDNALQWVFSDGLASVSLFVEVFDSHRHGAPGSTAMGATHTLTRRIGDWWLTVVGEVPPQTLAVFAQGLERIK